MRLREGPRKILPLELDQKVNVFEESRGVPDLVLPRDHSSPLRLHPWRLGSEILRLLQNCGQFLPAIADITFEQGFKPSLQFKSRVGAWD